MFNQDLQVKVRSATATRKTDSEDNISETTTVRLAFEFGSGVAGGLGEQGVMLYGALADGGLKSATIDLKGQAAVIDLGDGGNADQKLHLNTETRVVSLQLKQPGKDGAAPVATLTLRTPTIYDHLLWFVDRLEEVVPCKVQLQQTELEV